MRKPLIKFSYICLFTIYFYSIHIDCIKIVLCQYLPKLIWLLLEMIKLRCININLFANDNENRTKAFPCSRQDYHQNDVCYHVNIMHYSVTCVQLNLLLSLLLSILAVVLQVKKSNMSLYSIFLTVNSVKLRR